MAINDEELKDQAEQQPDVVVEEANQNQTYDSAEEIVVNNSGSDKKSSKKSGNKKPSKVKATFSELKKVTWPSFGSVVKKTAVVLSVTLVFLVVIIGIDQLLYLLYDLLTKNM